jgi:hypothetical protein
MKFQRHYKSEDGTSSIWHFDTNHSEYNPIMVEELEGDELPGSTIQISTFANTHEKRVVDKERVARPKKSLPKTKQKYLNPKTGKEVGYVRAKNLGLI